MEKAATGCLSTTLSRTKRRAAKERGSDLEAAVRDTTTRRAETAGSIVGDYKGLEEWRGAG
jgi:hypothetical protein